MYTSRNFKTKRELKAAVVAGERVATYEPGGIFPPKLEGEVSLEGPHFPQPHTWYARVILKNGYVVRVIS